jgi:glycosyltransferase involved in cell wall biosynthesis
VIKLGFYFSSYQLHDTDLSEPYLGNPGIGGTEFLVLMLAWYLNTGNNLEVMLFTQNHEKLPKSIKCLHAENLKEALEISKVHEIDLLVLPYYNESDEKIISDSKIQILLWYHLAIKKSSLMDSISRCKNIGRLVVVSTEVANYFRDHELFNKTVVINNFLVSPKSAAKSNKFNFNNYCCFVGRMDDSNGLDILAKSWSSVLKQNPDLKLVVIGGNTLYNKYKKPGAYGFADITYENKIVELFKHAGCIIDKNIFFTGTLGLERYQIMQNARVGIVNPSGKESFSVTALEFSNFGVPIVAGKDWGFFDSVVDKKIGFLVSDELQLAEKINYLLRLNEFKKRKIAFSAVEHIKKFEPDKIISLWKKELNNIFDGSQGRIYRLKSNYFHRKNWLKEIFRILKKKKLLKLPLILDKTYYKLVKELFMLNIKK